MDQSPTDAVPHADDDPHPIRDVRTRPLAREATRALTGPRTGFIAEGGGARWEAVTTSGMSASLRRDGALAIFDLMQRLKLDRARARWEDHGRRTLSLGAGFEAAIDLEAVADLDLLSLDLAKRATYVALDADVSPQGRMSGGRMDGAYVLVEREMTQILVTSGDDASADTTPANHLFVVPQELYGNALGTMLLGLIGGALSVHGEGGSDQRFEGPDIHMTASLEAIRAVREDVVAVAMAALAAVTAFEERRSAPEDGSGMGEGAGDDRKPRLETVTVWPTGADARHVAAAARGGRDADKARQALAKGNMFAVTRLEPRDGWRFERRHRQPEFDLAMKSFWPRLADGLKRHEIAVSSDRFNDIVSEDEVPGFDRRAFIDRARERFDGQPVFLLDRDVAAMGESAETRPTINDMLACDALTMPFDDFVVEVPAWRYDTRLLVRFSSKAAELVEGISNAGTADDPTIDAATGKPQRIQTRTQDGDRLFKAFAVAVYATTTNRVVPVAQTFSLSLRPSHVEDAIYDPIGLAKEEVDYVAIGARGGDRQVRYEGGSIEWRVASAFASIALMNETVGIARKTIEPDEKENGRRKAAGLAPLATCTQVTIGSWMGDDDVWRDAGAPGNRASRCTCGEDTSGGSRTGPVARSGGGSSSPPPSWDAFPMARSRP